MSPLVILALLSAPLRATRVVEAEHWELDLGGDLKSFAFSVWPYEWHLVPDESLATMGLEPEPLMPEDPLAQGALDMRLKLELELGEHISLSAHGRTAASYYSQSLEAGALSFGATGPGRGQAIDLSWDPISAPNYDMQGRMDRLVAKLSIPHLDLALGRQPVSFGSSWIFNPMDLVAPFSPTDVDQEYKPGVDAARVDAYFGMAGHVTAVAAYADDWSLEGTVLALHGSYTLGITDLGLLVASNHAEPVFGLDAAGSMGPVGWNSGVTLTLPGDEDPFVRAVVGAMYILPLDITWMGELYLQTFGATEASDYLAVYDSARFARGELWAAGRYYAASSLAREINPLVTGSVFAVVNLGDPSAMIGPALSWSAAHNAELAAGAFFGAGQRPHDVEIHAQDLQREDGTWITDEAEAELIMEQLMLDRVDTGSEFGMIPAVAYVQIKLYF